MQTSNPTTPGETTVATNGSGVTTFATTHCVKSFTDLAGALITREIDSFAEQVRKGIDNWRTAGKILVELSKRQPDIFRMITARHPHITDSVLQTFARIGRNEIWPPLLAHDSLASRLALRCNYDVQKELCEKEIEIATSWKNGKIATKKLRLHELGRHECAVLFDRNGGIRNIEQQAFALREPPPKTPTRSDEAINAPAPKLKNVDIGYFRLTLKHGVMTCETGGKSPLAQPVRLIKEKDGSLSATIVAYEQVIK